MTSAMQRLPGVVPNSLEYTFIVTLIGFWWNDCKAKVPVLFSIGSMLQFDFLALYQKVK
jgi:hypothetical protein